MGLDLKPTPKEKAWFTLEWNNRYLQLFCAALWLFALQIANFRWSIGNITDAFSADTGNHWFAAGLVTMGTLIPVGIIVIVAYKGFYQFWKDDQSGTTR